MSRTEPGGPLSRVSTVAYWFLTIEVLLVLTTLPGTVAVLLLERHASNIPLYALAAVPFGPALAAGVFAWRVFLRERDPSPAAQFWRGYRLGWRDALRVWVPALVALTLLGTNLAYRDAAGLPAALVPVQVLLAVAVLVWAIRTVVLAATFSFRWRDTARLGFYTLAAKPLVTLGIVSLLVLAAGIAAVTFDAVVVLLASVLVHFLVRNEEPVLALVEERFVAH
jgi:hypothetical protein